MQLGTKRTARRATVSEADCRAWVLAKREMQDARKKLDALAAKIKAGMGDLTTHEVGMFVIEKRDEPYRTLDQSALKAEHPNLAASFMVEKTRHLFNITIDESEVLAQT